MKQMALILAAAMTVSCVTKHEKNRPDGVKEERGHLPGPQTTCPVMEGKRINNRLYVDHQGFRIYVCCSPCVKAVRKKPGKFLKRLVDQGVTMEEVNQHEETETIAEDH